MHIRHVGTKLATFAKTSAIDLSKKQVIAGVMHYLNLQIPPYVQVDLFHISLTQFSRMLGYFANFYPCFLI